MQNNQYNYNLKHHKTNSSNVDSGNIVSYNTDSRNIGSCNTDSFNTEHFNNNSSNIEIIFETIDKLINNKKTVLVAIDGYCTSGKTTFADFFNKKYNCNIFHMDDFFLRPEQRTKKRLNEIGGNIDYERFNSEILLPLKTGKPFSYYPYDCHINSLGEQINITPSTLNIIEGSYSMHPFLSSAYDLSIFLNISPELQEKRILTRDVSLHKNFFEKWIPMEKRYFREYKISQKCNFIINEINL